MLLGDKRYIKISVGKQNVTPNLDNNNWFSNFDGGVTVSWSSNSELQHKGHWSSYRFYSVVALAACFK
jgi:hypothetical protein